MNIFITDENPVQCAKWLDDKRLNKMITETAQMLSTAVLLSGRTGEIAKSDLDAIAADLGVCKATHKNHPCAIWARESRDNFLWLFSHYQALYTEWRFRFKKDHKGFSKYAENILNNLKNIPAGLQTDFPNCSGQELPNIFDNYRACLVTKWKNDKRQPKWTNRIAPHWFDGILSDC